MSRELLKESLEALEYYEFRDGSSEFDALIEKLKTELAKPDPETVAWMVENHPTNDTFVNFTPNFNSHFEKQGCKITPLYVEQPDQSTRIAELIAQRTMQEEIIKTTTQRCVELEKQLAELQTIRGKCTLVPTDKLEDMQRRLDERKPLTSDQVREVYRTAFPKGPYIYTNDAFVFARMIENAHGIGEII